MSLLGLPVEVVEIVCSHVCDYGNEDIEYPELKTLHSLCILRNTSTKLSGHIYTDESAQRVVI